MKHFLGTRFADLNHLSSDVARYEKVRVAKASTRTGVHKRPLYKEVAKILAQQANETDSDFMNGEKLEKVKACLTELVEGQPFKSLKKKKIITSNMSNNI